MAPVGNANSINVILKPVPQTNMQLQSFAKQTASQTPWAPYLLNKDVAVVARNAVENATGTKVGVDITQTKTETSVPKTAPKSGKFLDLVLDAGPLSLVAVALVLVAVTQAMHRIKDRVLKKNQIKPPAV